MTLFRGLIFGKYLNTNFSQPYLLLMECWGQLRSERFAERISGPRRSSAFDVPSILWTVNPAQIAGPGEIKNTAMNGTVVKYKGLFQNTSLLL